MRQHLASCVLLLSLTATPAPAQPSPESPATQPATQPSDLQPYLDPITRYHRQELDPSVNAFTPLKQAMDALPPCPFIFWRHIADWDWAPSDLLPSPPDQVQQVTDWVSSDAARHAETLLDQATTRPACQFPLIQGNTAAEWTLEPALDLGRLQVVHARVLLANGQIEPAAQRLVAGFRLGKLLTATDGTIMAHIIGLNVINKNLRGYKYIARLPNAPPHALRLLIDELEQPLDLQTGLANSVRYEFNNMTLYEMLTLAQPDGRDGFTDELIDLSCNQSMIPLLQSLSPSQWEQLTSAIIYNPRYIDFPSTASASSAYFARYIRSFTAPWLTRDQTIRQDLFRDAESAQEQVRSRLRALIAYIHSTTPQLATTQPATTQPAATQLASTQPATTQPAATQLATTQPAYDPIHAQSLTDDIGSHAFIANMIRDMERIGESPRRMQADAAATAVILACGLYYQQHHQLPDTLDQLTRDGFLHRTPIDPFDGQPIRYNPRKNIVYTVGRDGLDDGGASDPDIWRGKDYVWKIR